MNTKEIAENILNNYPLSPVRPLVLVGGCIGDIVATIDSLPSLGSDVSAKIVDEQIGGCALNVARVVKKFDLPVVNAMPVGVGKWADCVKEELNELDLPINIQITDRDNGYCLAFVTPDKERTFVTFEGAETILRKQDLDKISVTEDSIVYLNGYELILENDLIAWVESIERAKFVVDFGPVIYNISPSIIDMLLQKEDVIFTLNKDEATFLLGSLGANVISNYAIKNKIELVIRMGSEGVISVDPEGSMQYIDALPVEVVDTIGAGDCHTGALIAGISSNLDLASSCLLGNISGAYTVTQVGAKNTSPLSNYEKTLKALCDK
ncbi:hypothetical protein HCQ94_02275 [Actinomyces sp. zg-332]|uniref:PfkB family carbohydrate kinase n=1 Tax=Actinomyces sp. zg-332 TaxID=2708340 RepID=UPI00141FED17|nr:PfkB family carbohydrate kinase [Actinomyces sp. zg-332]QPK94546.1 hypothetical protein HCQ94_02275 [Actinomyces sp. zg-332]